MRSTLRMSKMLYWANNLLADPSIAQEVKQGVASLLDLALMETETYAGYNHNFNWKTATEEERKAREFDRHYHRHSKLPKET